MPYTSKSWGRIIFLFAALAMILACSIPSPKPAANSTPTLDATKIVLELQATDAASRRTQAAPNVNAVSVVPVAPLPIAAKDFAALNASLEQKIAALNKAELKFIRDMKAASRTGRPLGHAFLRFQQGSTLTDNDLKEIAGKAMDAAILSDQLGELSARQDKGSDKAAQSAEGYFAIARTAFSLVDDAQTIRHALMNNLMPGSQAVELIAQYGVQLWSTSVTDGSTPGNPFVALAKGNAESAQALNPNSAAQVKSQINAGNSSIWIARSTAQATRTLDVPAAQLPVENPFDPQVLASLTTTEGQSDGNKAQQVATANLQRLGATASSPDPSQPRQIQVSASSIAVSGSEQIQAGNIPTFQQGTGIVVSKENPDDRNAWMQSVGLTGEGITVDQGKTKVEDTPPLVNMSISNIVVKNVKKLNPKPGSFGLEAIVDFDFTVSWSSTLVAPHFRIVCTGAGAHEITQASGTLKLSSSQNQQIYPGRMGITCWAQPITLYRSMLGEINVDFLVGDSAEATKRAVQLKTELADFYGTPTATPTVTSAPTATATEAKKPAPASTATVSLAPFTMNGTFSINFTFIGTYTTGFIKLSVDPATGMVTGSMSGAGTWSGEEKCENGDIKSFTSVRSFNGGIVGQVDTATGALINLRGNSTETGMTGKITITGGCTPKVEQPVDTKLSLSGTVDLVNHTAKGTITSVGEYDTGEGDWHAGE